MHRAYAYCIGEQTLIRHRYLLLDILFLVFLIVKQFSFFIMFFGVKLLHC